MKEMVHLLGVKDSFSKIVTMYDNLIGSFLTWLFFWML